MFTIKKEDGHEALSMPSTYKKSPREPKNPETLWGLSRMFISNIVCKVNLTYKLTTKQFLENNRI